jgi:S-formylglutathione hydrolase FrmB
MSTSTDSGNQPDTGRPAGQQSDRASGSRRWPGIQLPRWLMPAIAGVVVLALVVAALTGNLGGTSIISGWFPAALFWVTVGVCLLAVVLRRDVLREFIIGIPVGIVLAVILFVWLQVTQQVPPGAPRSLYVWLTIACLVAGLVIAGWRRAHWLRRIGGVLAVVLAVVSAGSAVNKTFDYYPTFDRLLGKSANNFLDNNQLTQMRRDAARTGQLPTHGATLAITIPGDGLKYVPRQAYVWVPPAWFGRDQPKLPVIELLHGTPGDPSNWTASAFADATSLAFAEQHKGVAPILVMPDVNGTWTGDTECANSAMYGNVSTYLTKTVPAFMQKKFNASTTTGSIAIAGLSEGGLCATTLALTNPKEYVAFGNYSGDVSPTYQYDNQQQTIQALFGGSQAAYNAFNPPYLLTHQRYPGLSGWFESGAQDSTGVQAAQTLQGLSAKAGINTCLATPNGGHDFVLWQQAYSDSLPWLSWKLKLTPEPASVPATCTSGH